MDTLKIGRFIARKRKEKNMTQEKLAEILGVTSKTISRWENGNYMPDLSLLKLLSETLDISINELLSGEEEVTLIDANENIFNITSYFNLMWNNLLKNIYLIFMFLGLFLIISSLMSTSAESSWGAIYSFIGFLIFILAFNRCLKKYRFVFRLLLTFLVSCLSFGFLIFFDYLNVVENNSVPRFRLSVTYTSDEIIKYETLFYNVFRVNVDTLNEYYIVDNLKKYNFSTIPKSPFNRDLSGIDNIIKYSFKYIGNSSNTGNLISSLPLSSNGYVFEINDNDLIINYNMTDWYYNDDLYVNRALLYNGVCLFGLIDNLEGITFNFSGSSYFVSREYFLKNYPNYFKVFDNGKVNKDNFNKYVEEVLFDDKFVKDNFVLFKRI